MRDMQMSQIPTDFELVTYVAVFCDPDGLVLTGRRANVAGVGLPGPTPEPLSQLIFNSGVFTAADALRLPRWHRLRRQC